MLIRETDLVVMVSLNVAVDDPRAAADVYGPLIADLGATALRWDRADPDGGRRGVNVELFCVSPPLPGESDERGLRRVTAPVLGLFGLPVWDFEVTGSSGVYVGEDSERDGYTVFGIDAATGRAMAVDGRIHTGPLRLYISGRVVLGQATVWLHGEVAAPGLLTAVRSALSWPVEPWGSEVSAASPGRFDVAVVLPTALPDGDLRRAADPLMTALGLDRFAIEDIGGQPVGVATADAGTTLYIRAEQPAVDHEPPEPEPASEQDAAEFLAWIRELAGTRIVLIARLVGDDAPLARLADRVRSRLCTGELDVEYTPSEPMGDGSRRVGVLVGLTDLGPREAVEAVMTCVGGSGWGEVFDGPRFSSATRVTQGQLRQLEVHAGARLTVQVTGD